MPAASTLNKAGFPSLQSHLPLGFGSGGGCLRALYVSHGSITLPSPGAASGLPGCRGFVRESGDPLGRETDLRQRESAPALPVSAAPFRGETERERGEKGSPRGGDGVKRRRVLVLLACRRHQLRRFRRRFAVDRLLARLPRGDGLPKARGSVALVIPERQELLGGAAAPRRGKARSGEPGGAGRGLRRAPAFLT